MTIDIEPFDAALGAEVHGVDLSKPVGDEIFESFPVIFFAKSEPLSKPCFKEFFKVNEPFADPIVL